MHLPAKTLSFRDGKPCIACCSFAMGISKASGETAGRGLKIRIQSSVLHRLCNYRAPIRYIKKTPYSPCVACCVAQSRFSPWEVGAHRWGLYKPHPLKQKINFDNFYVWHGLRNRPCTKSHGIDDVS